MVAALPVLPLAHKEDWSHFRDDPGSRAEFPMGADFISANGPRSLCLLIYARWACIPFSLAGALFAYLWSRELYGPMAGLLTLTLYVMEPNLLAHGELITPDAACASFGILAGYTFWRWLRHPSWVTAFIAGAGLGLAQLTKLSWLILYGLWPLLWAQFRFLEPKHSEGCDSTDNAGKAPSIQRPTLPQLAFILLLPLYIVNSAYAFDGFGLPLQDYSFVSATLSGESQPGMPGNRFIGTLLGSVRTPLPRQYLIGLDSQKKDFERFEHKSYLCGEWKDGGWWWYYAYGLLVKIPCGTWLLLGITLLSRLRAGASFPTIRNEIILIAPAICLFAVVSSQTEFSIHLRYVLPTIALLLVFLGQLAEYRPTTGNSPNGFAPKTAWGNFRTRCCQLALLAPVAHNVYSLAHVFPHQLAFFNEFAGGATRGHKHLLGSSFNWGQDFLIADEVFKGLPGELLYDKENCLYEPADIFPRMRPMADSTAPRGGFILIPRPTLDCRDSLSPNGTLAALDLLTLHPVSRVGLTSQIVELNNTDE